VHIRAALEFLAFTYVAGHLVIQLAASRWEDKLNSRPLPRVKSDDSFDSAALQFWPPDRIRGLRRPSHYSDDKTITTFAGRFDDVVPVRHPKR
jgi:hypothetical protein